MIADRKIVSSFTIGLSHHRKVVQLLNCRDWQIVHVGKECRFDLF